MMNLNHRSAIEIAARYTGIRSEIVSASAVRDGSLWDVKFTSTFNRYELYLDACTGEVLGFNSEPVLDLGNAYTKAGGCVSAA